MKTIRIFSIAAVLLFTACLFSCTKEENPVPEQAPALELKSGTVFTVAPSGNYEDDSYNIQTALNNAVAAGPGCTVKLTAGTFYLKHCIEIDGFDGYIRGAGKNKTVLTTHDKIDASESGGPNLNDNWGCLIVFRHGYVRMSDMTFKITDPEPTINLNDNDWFQNCLPILISVTGSAELMPPNTNLNGSSVFNNIDFIGGAGNVFDYNVGEFLWIGSWGDQYLTGGNQKITGCLFQGAVNSLSNLFDNNSTWLIGGNGASGNVFKDGHWPLTIGEFSNSTVEISYNTFENIDWGPIYITQGIFSDPADKSLSTYLIEHNIVEASECDGISIIDEPNYEGYGKTIDAIVKNNQVEMNSEGFWGGIFGFAADDIIVKSNTVCGKGIAGIYSGINGDATAKWFMQGNNVQNVTALAAPIWLGEGTSNYTVIGGSNKTNVWDEGTNNILTGVTKIQGNDVGQQAQQAHALMLQIMKQFKNH